MTVQSETDTQRPILFVGDIHIGRRPESLAELLEEVSLTPSALSPARAWEQTVEYAVKNDVRAVILAGDVIDREQDLLEAYGAVERGARELESSGIPLIAIAGNHDAQLLPRLAKHVNSVTLLGADATWQRHLIEDDERPVELIGWSFPQPHYRERPLEDERLKRLLDEPARGARILLVHGDVDVPNSPYAPIRSSKLEQLPVDAALLGHIHKPDSLDGKRPIGYLGSLVGLDAGEPGLHGPVEVRIGKDGTVRTTRVPLAPIRWEFLKVSVETDSPWSQLALTRHIEDKVNAWLREHIHPPGPVVLALRIDLEGRRPSEGWQAALRDIQTQTDRVIIPDVVRTRVIVERYRDKSMPAIDLQAIAQEHTPPGRIARFLLGDIKPDLTREANERWNNAWTGELLEPPDEDLDNNLRRAATRLLERMLIARRAGGAQ